MQVSKATKNLVALYGVNFLVLRLGDIWAEALCSIVRKMFQVLSTLYNSV